MAHLVLGERGEVIDANSRAGALGIDPKRRPGARFGELFAKRERKRLNAYLRNVRTRGDGEWIEATLRLPDGTEVVVSLQAVRVAQRLVVTITQARGAPPDAHKHVRRLLGAHDEERRRLSLELHDELGQTLGALEAGLAHLESTLADSTAREQVYRLRGSLKRAARELRRLAHGLYPRVLDDHGLRAALERLVVDTDSIAGIPVSLRMDDCTLSRPAELAVFRVVQEAVANAVRHGCPTAIRIELACESHRVTGSISDDGLGFTADQTARTGIGLLGMQERIEELGGAMSVTSFPNRGTVVKFELLESKGGERGATRR